jgi:C4-dicarboxylate transporter DctM subunit
MMFAAISGSSAATVAAVGKVMFPSLVKEGYSPRYAIGALATAGSLGILIPPSIPMILYGFVTETSISRLFIAGIIPGIIYGAGLMLMARFLAGREKVKPRSAIGRAEIGQAFASAGPALLLPAFIFIGIYGLPSFSFLGIEHDGGGIFTPTEAAVMSTALALIIGILIYKEMTLRGAISTVLTTAPTVGMVFFITTNALLFAFVVTQFGIPQLVAKTLVDLNMPPWLFLLLVNILLIFVGFFLEGTPTILMLVPILFPAAVQLGIDPIHFCIIVVVNIELGLVTPPVGFNLFVGSSISGLPVAEVFKAVLPWMSVTIAVLLLVTYVPELSLFLPNLIFN